MYQPALKVVYYFFSPLFISFLTKSESNVALKGRDNVFDSCLFTNVKKYSIVHFSAKKKNGYEKRKGF